MLIPDVEGKVETAGTRASSVDVVRDYDTPSPLFEEDDHTSR